MCLGAHMDEVDTARAARNSAEAHMLSQSRGNSFSSSSVGGGHKQMQQQGSSEVLNILGLGSLEHQQQQQQGELELHGSVGAPNA